MDGQNFNNDNFNNDNFSYEQNVYQDNSFNTANQAYNGYTQQAAPANKADALAIISLIAGILSIVICCTAYWALIPAIVGIVCAIISKKNNGTTGVAIAGLVCSIVGAVLAIVWFIAVGIVAFGMNEYSEIMNYYYY